MYICGYMWNGIYCYYWWYRNQDNECDGFWCLRFAGWQVCQGQVAKRSDLVLEMWFSMTQSDTVSFTACSLHNSRFRTIFRLSIIQNNCTPPLRYTNEMKNIKQSGTRPVTFDVTSKKTKSSTSSHFSTSTVKPIELTITCSRILNSSN